jgi:hypothetical protein
MPKAMRCDREALERSIGGSDFDRQRRPTKEREWQVGLGRFQCGEDLRLNVQGGKR